MPVISKLRRSAPWRFLALLPHGGKALTAGFWALVVVRSGLFGLFTLSTGLLIGAVAHHSSPTLPLVLLCGVFFAMNALAPVHETIGSQLGDRTGSWLHDRLMLGAARPPGLAHLEEPDLAADLETVRVFDNGVAGPPLHAAMSHIADGFVTWGAGLVQSSLLFGYRWWAPPLLAGAWILTHVLLRDAAGWKVYYGDTPATRAGRRAEYEYKLAVEAPASKEIRMFGLAGWMVDRVMEGRRFVGETVLREQRLRRGPVWWGLLTLVTAYAILCASLAHDAAAGAISITALVVFVQAAVGTSSLGFGEPDWWFRGSAEPIPLLLGLQERMARAGALPDGGRSAAGLPARELRFCDVTFGYPGREPVLKGFDLTIPAGTSLAIVGPNGAGKTTLAKLLCRFYDPTAGAIEADGVDLRELSIESWRGQTAAVFQDFVRLELPLRDNVAPRGAPDASLTAALEAAGAAGLAGLDQVLSRAYEGGTDLSGGQWQRIALARALHQVQEGAAVVLLDEPTAQLDVRGEAEIFDRILERTRGRTTILISHRFSTVRHADRICVLEHGRVVELGSHVELMELGGRYRQMFELQAARFEEPLEEEEADAAPV